MKYSSTKTKLKPQEVRINDLSIRTPGLLKLDLLGNGLILLSGLLPFIHTLVPDKPLEDKFFGFTSIHRFLYSAGTHLSLLFVVLGVIIIFSVITKDNIEEIKKKIIYTLISPFISAVFFMAWVFFPGVNYDSLAYIFISFFIVSISVAVMLRLISFLRKIRKSIVEQQLFINQMLKSSEDK